MNPAPQPPEGIFPPYLLRQSEEVLRLARAQGLTITTAESCTGGLLAACLTEIPGASDVLHSGFVVYDNTAKERLLGIPPQLLREHGAVSREICLAMAQNALQRSGADIALAVTGIAGPGGGTADKPLGLVHFACAHRDGRILHRERRFAAMSRRQIRLASVDKALSLPGAILTAAPRT